MDDKLTAKFTSLENLYVYCMYIYPCFIHILIVSLQEQRNKLRSNLGRLIVSVKLKCHVPCHTIQGV